MIAIGYNIAVGVEQTISAVGVEKETAGQSVIHFEPGVHPLSAREYQAISDGIGRGNLNNHYWNPEVTGRIRSYGYNTTSLFIALDGEAPSSMFPDDRYKIISTSETKATWANLPARPNELNQSGIVYVVKGDSDVIHLPEIIFADDPEKALALSLSIGLEESDDIVSGENTAYILSRMGEEMIYGSGMFAITLAYLKLHAKEKNPERKIHKKTNNFSRRNFLKGVVLLVGAGLMLKPPLQPYAADFAARSSTEDDMEFWKRIDQLTYFNLSDQVFTDGRTALLMTKAEALREIHPESEQVVLMGNNHETMADKLRNKTERSKRIQAYAKLLIDIGRQFYLRERGKELPAELINRILDYLAQTDVVQVTDPGGPSVQPGLKEKIKDFVIPYSSFKCQEILDATQEMRIK